VVTVDNSDYTNYPLWAINEMASSQREPRSLQPWLCASMRLSIASFVIAYS